MPEIEPQQKSRVCSIGGRKISIRLVLVLCGVLLAIAGWVLNRQIISFAGLVLVLASSLTAGGGT